MVVITKNSCTKFINFIITSIILLIVAHQTHQQQEPNLKCGRTKFNSRIAGGSEAIANEFPWMVHFQVSRRDGQLSSICGGSLISHIHVLTATHCVTRDGIKMNDIFNITLGIHDVTVRRQTVEWKTIVIPALSDDVKQDIAIITLSDPVNFTENVQPICLPWADESDHVNESVYLTGWGQYNSSNLLATSSVLRKMKTTILSVDQCREISNDDVICTEHRYCHGDDGGPLNYYNVEYDRWFVIGVAGRGDVDCSSTRNGQNIFTRLRNRLDFIREYADILEEEIPMESTDATRPTPSTITQTTGGITSTTPEPIIFTCGGKPDGNYPDPSSACSNQFYKCSNGVAYLFNCSSVSLFYREEIHGCDWPDKVAGCATIRPSTITQTTDEITSTTPKTIIFSCNGKPDGNYPASVCSTKYYVCSNGYQYIQNCPGGLIYNTEIGRCDYWPANVAGCQ